MDSSVTERRHQEKKIMDSTNNQEVQLLALSPLDGRYAGKIAPLKSIFSEFGLIKYRVIIEVKWLIALSNSKKIVELPSFSKTGLEFFENIIDQFSLADAISVKKIEHVTNHDIKAVEYFLKDQLTSKEEIDDATPFIHFACTSEDINNLAYALMLKEGREEIILPALNQIKDRLKELAREYSNTPMLARTHGQAASPTTMGKELANFLSRLKVASNKLNNVPIYGKFNGAVGNFNAHAVAYPDVNWPELTQSFVEDLGLSYQKMTTQIEPHDGIAELCQNLQQINTILLDLNRDLWTYISLNYFRQKVMPDEIGSSTMPHKVNPIDFENSEGNIGIANAILSHLVQKLPISRLQRDLTDSTTLRNLGVAFGHSLVAYTSILKGLDKIELNTTVLALELDQSWEILSEAIQTVMRRHAVDKPYEQLKELTRGKEHITPELLKTFIEQLPIPNESRDVLLQLSPKTYLGCAVDLTLNSLKEN